MTVQHQYGETTVAEEPQRVVTVGATEQDILLQLGVVPVGVTQWYDGQASASWPWSVELLDGAEPEILDASDGFDFDRVADLEPDLIVGTDAALSQQDYDRFSEIAPTITNPMVAAAPDAPWQNQVAPIAQALGREDEGQRIVDDVNSAYAEVAAEHPEWAESSASFADGDTTDGLLRAYPAGLNTSFLTDLGFTITPGLERFSAESGAQAEISPDKVGAIDADVVVFATEDQEMYDALQAFGGIGSLEAVTENRAVYTDDALAAAIGFDTPLSRAYVLKELTPLLEQASAGTAPRAFPS